MQNKSSIRTVFLRTKRGIMRPLKESDIPLLTKWVNDPDVRQFVQNYRPLTELSEKEFYEKAATDTRSVVLLLEVNEIPIGLMGIHNIDWKNRLATTGAMIGEKEYWGKGYGTEFKMVLLDYAFNTLNLHRIESRVYAFNKRSLNYSLRCGYKLEGTLRKTRFVKGKYWNEHILGVFKEEWEVAYKKWITAQKKKR